MGLKPRRRPTLRERIVERGDKIPSVAQQTDNVFANTGVDLSRPALHPDTKSVRLCVEALRRIASYDDSSTEADIARRALEAVGESVP